MFSAVPLFLTVFLLALLAAAPAGAATISSGGFDYVSKRYTPEPNAVTTLKAPCPAGTHVWGGGHYNDGVFAEAVPRHSYPYDAGDADSKPDDGWAAQVSGIEGVAFWMYATCAAPTPDYQSGSITAGAQTRTNGVVDCEPGTEAVEGGTRGHRNVYEVLGGPGLGELHWAFGLDNYTDDPREIRVFAVCVERRVFSSSANQTVQPRTQAGRSVECPDGTRVVGGGAGHGASYLDAVVAATRPQGFGPGAADSWQVYMDNLSNSNTFFFSVQAACVKPLR
jgi:hypothetical protein